MTELTPVFAPVFDQKVQSVLLISERVGRYKAAVSSLRQSGRPSAELTELLNSEIKTDLENIHRALRGAMGYLRKDLQVDLSQSLSGRLSSPEFDYTIRAVLGDSQPNEVVWEREVDFSKCPEALKEKRILNVFSELVDDLRLTFAEPLAIAEIVDHLETLASPGLQIDYGLDCDWCEISNRQIPATLRFEGKQLRVFRQPGTSLSLSEMIGLIEPQRFGLA